MLTNQVLSEALKLHGALVLSSSTFAELVEAFAKLQTSVEAQLSGFAKSQDKWAGAAGQIHSIYSTTTRMLTGRPFRDIFSASKSLQDALSAFAELSGQSEGPIHQLSQELHEFECQLEIFLGTHSMEQASPMLMAAARLDAKMMSLRSWLEVFIQLLIPKARVGDGEEILSLTLDADVPTLAEFVEKLRALQELCELLEEILKTLGHLATYRLTRLEFGSIYLEVVAEKLGIALLKRLLVAVGGFLYRNHTIEGQLKHGVPAKIAVIKDMMKLRASLLKDGLDVEGIDEALEEQTEALVRKIGVLIGTTPSLKIGERVLKRDQPTLAHEPVERLGHTPNNPEAGSW